jgi:hypothetical protein
MWSWQTVVEAAVGAAVPLVPIYIFGFRQIIESKDAQIDALKQQNEHLQKEVVAEVIREKLILVEDVKARAKEKVESEEATQKEVDRITGELQSLAAQRKVLDAAVETRLSIRAQLGVLTGLASLVRARAWLSGLAERGDLTSRSMNSFLDREMGDLRKLLAELREDSDVLTVHDVHLSADITKQLREEAMAEKKALIEKGAAGV